MFQSLYRFVLDDLYDYPSLEKELKVFQRLLSIQHRQWVTFEYLMHYVCENLCDKLGEAQIMIITSFSISNRNRDKQNLIR